MYFEWVCLIAEIFSVKRSNEEVERQNMRLAKNSEPTGAEGAGSFGPNNTMFVEERYPLEEDDIVVVFKRYADGETNAKQRKMQDKIGA